MIADDHNILKHFPIGLAIFTIDGQVLEANEAFADIIGIPSNDLVHTNYWDIVPQEAVESEKSKFYLFVPGEKYGPYESELIHSSKNRVKVSINTSVVLSDNKMQIWSTFEKRNNGNSCDNLPDNYEEVCRNLINYAPVGMLILEKGTIKFANYALAETLGYSHPDELLGLKIMDFIHPLYKEIASERLKSLFSREGTRVQTMEEKFIRKDGKEIDVIVVGQSIKYQGNMAVQGYIFDISESIRVQKAVEESETKFRTLFENSFDPLFLSDLNGNLIDANQMACDSLGYKKEELLRKKITEVDEVFSNFEELQGLWAKIIEEGKTSTESVHIRKDGSKFPVELFISAVELKGQTVIAGYARDISERKQTEKALYESENKFRKAFYTSPDSININRMNDGMYIEVNDGFTRVTGYTRQEVIGKTSAEINIWVDPSRRKKLVEGLLASGYVSNLEAKFRLKNGNILDGLMSASIIDFNGVPHILSITRDISELKHAQKELQESEERFRNIFENNHAVMMLVDPFTGKIINVNPAACDYYGYNYKQMVDELYIHDINTIGVEKTKYLLLQALNNEKNHFVLKHRLSNNQIRDVEIYGGRIKVDEEVLLYSIVHDITERLAAEEEIRKLSMAVRQSPASIVITNPSGIIEYVNPKFEESSGYSFDEVVGKKQNILKSGHTPNEEYKILWNTITSGKVWKGEFLNKNKLGNYYWETASISPIIDLDNNISHFLAVKEDITEAKKYQKELITAKEMAERSERLKTEFLAQMSHEIRSPINVILSFTNLLKDDLDVSGNDLYPTVFNSIETAGRRIIRTIDLIINMSEVQTGTYEIEKKKIDIVTSIIEPLFLEYKTLAADTGIKLILERETEDACIFVDEYSVMQIMSNLLDNAIKYTGDGYVKIRISKNNNDRIKVEVIDTGIGMSEQYLTDLFRPFSQEQQGYTRPYEGNGLGLALVKNYCELNGAEISVSSKKGSGSTFTVTFNKC